MYKNMFFLDSRVPQRAAIPPRKMRSSKVGAGPWWGRDPSSVPGTLAPMEYLPCLPSVLKLVAPYTPGVDLA